MDKSDFVRVDCRIDRGSYFTLVGASGNRQLAIIAEQKQNFLGRLSSGSTRMMRTASTLRSAWYTIINER
jgi:hypothetical protein